MDKRVAYGLCALASLAFGLLAIRGVDFVVFWRGISEMDYSWALAAIAVLAVSVYIRVIRWRLLFAHDTRPEFGPAGRALLIGLLFNQIMPLRAGEAARVVALKREAGT